MIASSTKSITNIIDRFFDNIVKESPNIKYHTVNAILNLVHIFMMFVFVKFFHNDFSYESLLFLDVDFIDFLSLTKL